MATKPTTKTEEISILQMTHDSVSFALIGTSPLIFNAVSFKSKQMLLMPRGRMTDADKAANLKHNPPEEFRNSVYRSLDDAAPTRLIFPASAFKGAMMTAALDLPGTKKTEIGRLSWVEGQYVAIYGVPQLLMSVVRSADINRTPDIRTRAILPEWACVVHIRFVRPKLSAQAMAHLVAAGGITSGIGDFRQEKGKGSFGQYQPVDAADAAFKRIVTAGGRAAQDAALADPVCYDVETEEMLSWFSAEIIRLGDAKQPSKKQRKAA